MPDLFDLLLDLLAWLGLRPPTVAASNSIEEEGENNPTVDPNG